MIRQFLLILLLAQSSIQSEILTLSKAEQKAVSCSYELRAAFYNEHAREWERLNALSNYMPSISYSAGINRLDKEAVNNQAFGLIPPQVQIPDWQNNFSHTFSISQPLFNGGAEIFAIRIAKETKSAIELQMKDLQFEAIYNTRKAYFDCIVSAEQEAAAKDDLSWTVQNLNKAKIRHEGGQIPLTDVLQWESEVAKKEAAAAFASASRTTMILTLFHSLGISTIAADTSVQLQTIDAFESWYSKGPALMSSGVENNLQFLALSHYQVIAAESKNLAISKFLPNLNAFLQTSWLPDSEFIPHKSAGWIAGLTFNLTLFSGFRNGTNFKKVNCEYNKSIIDQQKTENQIRINIDRIKLFYKASYDGVRAAKIQRDLMDKQLHLMQERYDGGLVNQSQLLEVALGLQAARVGYIQKLLECLLLESEYLRNTGILEVYK